MGITIPWSLVRVQPDPPIIVCPCLKSFKGANGRAHIEVLNPSVCRTVPSAKASFSTVLLSSNLSEQRILCGFERNENAVLNVSSKSGNAMLHFLIFSFSPALRFSSSRYGSKKYGFSMCQYRINFLRFVSMRYVVCSVLRRMRGDQLMHCQTLQFFLFLRS